MIQLNPIIYKQDGKRTAQQNVLPHAIKGRNISSTAIVIADQSSFAPTTFGNGQAARFTSTTTQTLEEPILVEKYWSAYIGTVTAANNIFNSSYDTSGLIIRGPIYDEMRWDGLKYTTTSTLIIQNVSAGSITVTAYVREKMFMLSPTATNA